MGSVSIDVRHRGIDRSGGTVIHLSVTRQVTKSASSRSQAVFKLERWFTLRSRGAGRRAGESPGVCIADAGLKDADLAGRDCRYQQPVSLRASSRFLTLSAGRRGIASCKPAPVPPLRLTPASAMQT